MTDPIRPNPGESEDLDLVAFLKSNRPPVPPPNPQAEARLMESIAQSQQTQAAPQHRQTKKRSWLLAAIALGTTFIGGILWQFRSQNSGVFAQREIELEAFLIESWLGVSTEDNIPEVDWLSTPEDISHTDPDVKPLAYQSLFEESHP